MEEGTVTENVFQLGFIDMFFQVLEMFTNLILGVASIFMSGFFGAILG